MGEAQIWVIALAVYGIGVIPVGAAFARFGHPLLGRPPFDPNQVGLLGFTWPVWVLNAVLSWVASSVTRAIVSLAETPGSDT